MEWHYHVYGLSIRSSGAIPHLQAVTTPKSTDIDVYLRVPIGEVGDFRLYYVHPQREYRSGAPILTVSYHATRSQYYFLYYDHTEFLINKSGTKIWTNWADNETVDNMATYLLGPILGFVLRLRGTACLHASAVAINNQAAAFMGAAGVGKSTLATIFALQNHAILSDDIVALTPYPDGYLVEPAYPRLRLWDTSVELLYGEPTRLPRILEYNPDWDKRYVDLTSENYRFQAQALPLAAIYQLGAREDSVDAPRLETIPPGEALITLIANTYRNELLDKAMRAHEFKQMGELVEKVPLRRVIAHEDPTHLPTLRDLICRDLSR